MKRSISTDGPEPELPKEGSGSDHLAPVAGGEGDAEISLDADGVKLASSSSSGLVERLTAHAPAQTRYVLQGEVARGGMGAILKVWDEDLRRTLAMKVILGRDTSESLSETPSVDERVLARFLEEAQVTGQLDHPGIVPVHELGLDSKGRVYFTMPLVKGRDLKEIIELVHARQEGWTETKAIGVILKVCEAMGYAHSKGVLHRDLKPANIMVGRFGQTYVMDWGLAKVIGRKDTRDIRLKKAVDAMPSLVHVERQEMMSPDSDSPLVTMDGTIVGTPAYMPPEQARGAIEEMTARSDVYAVGAMLYHLLTGEAPYVPHGAKLAPLAILNAVLEGPPQPVHEVRRGVAAELSAICERAMARDPAQRYASTLELANDLQAYLEGRVVRAYETGAIAEFKKWVDRNRGMAAALAAAVLLLVVGLAVSSSLYFKAEESAALARTNNERANAKAVEAEDNALRAQASEKEVRGKSYVTNLLAAAFSLFVNDVADCKRHLEACPPELRGWEWRHLALALDTSLRVIHVPKGQVASLVFSIDGPKGQVTSVAFSPDGSEIMTGTDVGAALFWNVETGQRTGELGGPTVDSGRVVFAPDGARVAGASMADGRVRIRSRETGDLIPGGLVPDARSHAAAVAYSPDGTRLATAYADGTVRMWDTVANRALSDISGSIPGLPVPIKSFTSIAFSRDGKRIAVGAGDGTVLVWNAETGESIAVLRGHDSGVTSVAFSSESSRLVSAAYDKTVRIWDLDKSVCTDVLRGHDAQVYCVAVSPDGSRIASASADKTVRIWDAGTHHQLAVLHGHEKAVRSVAFSPDGARLVSGSTDMTARIWDAGMSGAVAELAQPSPAHSNSGLNVSGIASIAFSPDGGRIVAGLEDGVIQVWNPTTHEETAVLRGHSSAVNSVAFSHDGAHILSASSDKTLRTWDAANYAEQAVLRGHQGQVFCAAYSPDGTRIVSGSEDKTAQIRDAKSGSILSTLRGHDKALQCVAFSPDGSRVATGSLDRTARIWDARTGTAQGAPLVHAEAVLCAAFSPDGTRIATASGESVYVWTIEPGGPPMILVGHDLPVQALAFSPDGKRIISGSYDNTIRIWNGRTGEALFTLRGTERRVNSVAFSPDGSRIAAGSSRATLFLWETEPLSVHFEERRSASAAVRDAAPLVDALFDEWISSADVIHQLQIDTSLEPKRRETAIRLAGFRGDDPMGLYYDCGQIVLSPDAEPKAYARALRMAETAWIQRPENNYFLSLLGVAQYRAGEYEKAVATLERAQQKGRSVPRDVAFLAMAQHELGRSDASRATLALLRELMRKKRWADDKEYLGFLREAETLIAGEAGSNANGK
jgi:WD40 repeat protein/serine/threonine protein kinase